MVSLHENVRASAREYATWLREECGDETALTRAVLDAQSDYEIAAIAVALLERNEALADPDYRFGGTAFDPRLAAIAHATGWPEATRRLR